AFETATSTSLSTVYLAYVSPEDAQTLQAMILAPNSALFVGSTGIPNQLANQINPALPLNSISIEMAVSGGLAGSSTASGSASGATAGDATSQSRRDAIIGVCAAFGAILVGVLGWWAAKSWKRKQDIAHHRLTYNSADMHQAGGYGATGFAGGQVVQSLYVPTPNVPGGYSDNSRPNSPMYNPANHPYGAAAALQMQQQQQLIQQQQQMQQADQDPFADNASMEAERRRSFFYAEDSLRGYAVPREEEDQGTTYTQMIREQQGLDPNVKRRMPIQASAISAPILRESSLNW
ncbi:hypothetical protein FRB97_000649, partial [Tulasnella sp. 331]